MTENTLIEVTNRSDFIVGYPVPDGTNGQERIFSPGETKKITFEELKKLAWQVGQGGLVLLKEYLFINNEEAIDLILGSVEPEYYYTEEKVKNLLLNGSVDQLLDTFDFGTEGVIDLIKKYAVDLEIPDIRKREIIQEKTGLDVNKAIYINNEYKEDNVEETPKGRRAAPVEAPETPVTTRRAGTPAGTSSKYKVVSQ